MNTTRYARLIIIFMLTHFIPGNCLDFTFIYCCTNRKKVNAERNKYRKEFIKENAIYMKGEVRIAEVTKYYEAITKEIIPPVEDYINKTKGEVRSPLPNKSIKGSQDVLVPTPKETVGIIFVSYLGFWISVKLKVCNMAYELSKENDKIADHCDENFEIMRNAVDSVFRDFLPYITANEIAAELSCLDLKFLMKTTSPMNRPYKKCPFNIIQWEKMKTQKWLLNFSTNTYTETFNYSTAYYISEINSALFSVINLLELRNVQRYFSALLNCKTNLPIIDEVMNRYFPFNPYTGVNFIDAITEKKLEKSANPIETLLSAAKKWLEIDMESLSRR